MLYLGNINISYPFKKIGHHSLFGQSEIGKSLDLSIWRNSEGATQASEDLKYNLIQCTKYKYL